MTLVFALISNLNAFELDKYQLNSYMGIVSGLVLSFKFSECHLCQYTEYK